MAKTKKISEENIEDIKPRYLKSQIRTLDNYRIDIDIIDLELLEDYFYTLEEVDDIIAKFKGEDK